MVINDCYTLSVTDEDEHMFMSVDGINHLLSTNVYIELGTNIEVDTVRATLVLDSGSTHITLDVGQTLLVPDDVAIFVTSSSSYDCSKDLKQNVFSQDRWMINLRAIPTNSVSKASLKASRNDPKHKSVLTIGSARELNSFVTDVINDCIKDVESIDIKHKPLGDTISRYALYDSRTSTSIPYRLANLVRGSMYTHVDTQIIDTVEFNQNLSTVYKQEYIARRIREIPIMIKIEDSVIRCRYEPTADASFLLSEHIHAHLYNGLPIIPISSDDTLDVTLGIKSSTGLHNVISVPCKMDYVFNGCAAHIPPMDLNQRECVCDESCDSIAVFEIEQLSYTQPYDIIAISVRRLVELLNTILASINNQINGSSY